MKQFKIRPSQCGKIMGALKAGSITEKQKQAIHILQGKPRTEKQQIELERLTAKRDAPPELPEGAKTYCKQWLKEQLYGRRKEFSSKYTDRGNISEDESIRLIGEYIGDPTILKNEDPPLSNDFMEGTYDTKTHNTVYDAKSVWDFSTFPLFNDKLDKDYEWQIDLYMELTGMRKGEVVYCLVDLPEELLQSEIKKLTWQGIDQDEAEAKMRDYHSYGDLPLNLRLKAYKVTYDKSRIEAVERRVIMCREYIEELVKNLTTKQKGKENE